MSWKVLHTGPATASDNMSLDAQLLKELDITSGAILHHYDWVGRALTYGHFIDPEQYLKPEGLAVWGYQAARRPTGGGIIFHTCDLAFSVLIPVGHPLFTHNTMANYATVNSAVLRAVEKFLSARGQRLTLLESGPEACHGSADHFCMAHPTRYDVMAGGRKVGGAAQRRTREGLLHQGSICLTMVPQGCLKEILADGAVAQKMSSVSYPLLGEGAGDAEVAEARAALRLLLQEELLR